MFHGELFPFQVPAYERMLERKCVVVAYEMGLGKTPMTIATLEELLESDVVEAGLIIVPAALKYQWLAQVKKFTGDEANVIVIDGTPKQREAQYARAATWAEYIIINYELLLNDWKHVMRLPRDFVVLDEATAIKNFKAKRTRKIKRLQAEYKFALTGQPVENRPEEIYSIMEWVDRDVLGRFDVFDKAFIVRNPFGGVQRYKNIPQLHRRLQTAMVRKRRTDEDVRDQLPDVTEQVLHIDLDPAARRLYKSIAADLLADLEDAQGMGGFDLFAHYGKRSDSESGASLALRGRIMSKVTCLRMLCDHPELLNTSAAKYAAKQMGDGQEGSEYAAKLAETGRLDKPGRPRKFEQALELLNEILDANPANKVVVFSTFKPTLRWLQDALKVESVQFTGDMDSKEKHVAKETFSNDPKCRVFLSSDAGGYGVDLPIANYLINYDLPWSAGALDQRNARIVRLSSEHEKVAVLNLVVKGSIEERQYAMLEDKRLIASAVVDGKGATAKGQVLLSVGALREFLATSQV